MRNSSPGAYLWLSALAWASVVVSSNWSQAHEGHHPAEEGGSDKEVHDPYAVPDAPPEELLDFIRTARERMQPKSVSDARRMFEAREHAADHILTADAADESTRLEAVTAKLESMGALMRLGDIDAPARLDKFIEEGAKTETGDVGELLSNIRLERKFERWKGLNAADRDQLIDDLRAHILVDDVSWSRVRVLLRFAETLAETDDAPRAAALVRELLPHIATSGAPMVAKQVDMIEGVARRLELVGQPIEVAGTTLEGESLDWQEYRGKLVLIDFWATWCPPCIAEMEEVEKLYAGYREKGFEVVGVNLDKNRQDVEKLVAARELSWRNLFHATDGPGAQHPLAVAYGITSIPRAILVDREGRVVTTRANSKSLARLLKQELGEPVPPQPTAAKSSVSEEGPLQQVKAKK
jgi:thiol-disulfide isomerase/thioredoxin